MPPNWVSGTLNQVVTSSVPAGGRGVVPDGPGSASGGAAWSRSGGTGTSPML